MQNSQTDEGPTSCVTMSESEGMPSQLFRVEAYSEFESDDDALEALVQLKELDFGNLFDEREVKLDSAEDEGISINFHHSEVHNSLHLNSGDDSNVSIYLTLVNDDLSEAGSVFSSIKDSIGEMMFKSIQLFKNFDVDFHSLDLPIEESTDLSVIGIRIDESNREFIVQKNTEEDGTTTVNMVMENIEEEFGDSVSELGVQERDSTIEFIESLQ